MPSYYACGLKVKLLVSALSASTNEGSSIPSGHRNSYDKTKQVQQALDQASVLQETIIPYHGEDRPPYFLDGDTTIPFFMVEAGRVAKKPKTLSTTTADAIEIKDEDLQPTAVQSTEQVELMPPPQPPKKKASAGCKRKQTSLGTVLKTPTPVDDANPLMSIESPLQDKGLEQTPWTTQKALSIEIELHETRSFKRDDAKPLPLRTEIYYNGNLANCGYYNLHQRGETMKPQRHSGTRMGRIVEIPWVLMTRAAVAFGGENLEDPIEMAKQRWMAISAALQLEAEQCGFNNKGRRSPTGACLNVLAGMEMPDMITNLTSSGSPSFGVIDVVISRGKGAKAPPQSGHLSLVQRMVDPRYKVTKLVVPTTRQHDTESQQPEEEDFMDGMGGFGPNITSFDGTNDPKTPPNTKKRRANIKSSANVPSGADDSDVETNKGSTSLGFLASARSTDFHAWDIAEPPIHSFAIPVLSKRQGGRPQPLYSNPMMSSSPFTTENRVHDVTIVHPREHRTRSGERKTLIVKLKPTDSQPTNSGYQVSPARSQTAGKDLDLVKSYIDNHTPKTPAENIHGSASVPKIKLTLTRTIPAPVPTPPQSVEALSSANQATSTKLTLRATPPPPQPKFTRRLSMTSSELSPLQRLARRPDVATNLSNLKPILAIAEGEEAALRTSALWNDSSPSKNRELTEEFKNEVLLKKVPQLKLPVFVEKKLTHASKDPSFVPELSNVTRSGKLGSPVEGVLAMPELSKGCVLTYAHTINGIGPLRQIKAERAGTFEEVDVVMAVRFLVGVGAGEE